MTDQIIETKDEPSRREQLSAMFDNAEKGEPLVAGPVVETAPDRSRDESGRFAPKAAERPAEPVVVAPEAAPVATTPSLTTWRKEYLPIQEKLAKGQGLTPDEAKKLAEYNVERERQYSTGISTYKGEAQNAKEFTDAMAEFLPILQQHNIKPAQWIQNLGRAHSQLALGTPEQKIRIFGQLAKDYGVPMGAITQSQNGQLDPVSLQLMQEVQNLKNSFSGIATWKQQQEDQVLQQEVAKFQDATKYPHFAQVRESMIQLLESGVAQNPDQAYTKAVRLDDAVWEAEKAKLTAPPPVNHRTAVVKAKAASGQVRSATPSSLSNTPATKDRRAALSAAFEAVDTGRV